MHLLVTGLVVVELNCRRDGAAKDTRDWRGLSLPLALVVGAVLFYGLPNEPPYGSFHYIPLGPHGMRGFTATSVRSTVADPELT